MPGRNAAVLVAFSALVLISFGLKAWPPEPAPDSPEHVAKVDAILVKNLRDQGFSTAVKPIENQSPVVYAERGSCRLAVRDGSLGDYQGTLFARDAAGIGPIRYLYRGQRYAAPPSFGLLQHHVERKLLGVVGIHQAEHIPLALASSRSCRGTHIRLEDIQVE